MEQFNFSNVDFTKGFVESGSKVMQSNRPEVILTSTHNRFVVNDKARDLMGIKTGSKIWLNDMLSLSDDNEQRFFAAVDVAVDGNIKGAVIGKNSGFTYSKVYGAILASIGNINTKEIKFEDLERVGLMESRVNEETGNKTFVATKKIAMEVVKVADDAVVAYDESGNEVRAALFMFTNFSEYTHTPQFSNLGNEIDEDGEEIAEVEFEDSSDEQ